MDAQLQNAPAAPRSAPPAAKERSSNLELFRILTMLLIIAHHYVVNSALLLDGGPIAQAPLALRSLFLAFFGAWGKIGINCFVMITGYFMCRSRITARKFARLFFEVLFYRVVISLIFAAKDHTALSLRAVLMLFVPIRAVSDGFTAAFLLFYLLIPFLNVLIRHLTRRTHLLLLLWCGFAYVLLPTIGAVQLYLGRPAEFGIRMNYVGWFSVIYLTAAFLRCYPRPVYERTGLWAALTGLLVLLCLGSVYLCQRRGGGMAYLFVSDSNNLLAAATGVSSFLLFKNLRIPQSRALNTLAAAVFGVFRRGAIPAKACEELRKEYGFCEKAECVGRLN